MRQLSFTFDLDWAPEPMIDDLAGILEQHDLPATVFCTHRSPAVDRLLALPRAETGIHPNYLSDGEPGQILERLAATFPTARAVRNHGLYFHSGLLPICHRAGLKILSNDLMFLRPNLEPWYDWSGMVRVPIFWEDDVHCAFFGRDFSVGLLQLDQPGLKVLNFHPVHLCLNTRDLDEYRAAKGHLADGAWTPNPGTGIRTLFEQVVAQAGPEELITVGEIAAGFARHNAYHGHYRPERDRDSD